MKTSRWVLVSFQWLGAIIFFAAAVDHSQSSKLGDPHTWLRSFGESLQGLAICIALMAAIALPILWAAGAFDRPEK